MEHKIIIPGFNKDEITIKYHNGYYDIRAVNDSGDFRKVFTSPELQEPKATLENGILTIKGTIPTKEIVIE